MAKTWVLHTETKGTGANVVPLERANKRPSAPEHVFKLPGPRPPVKDAPKPKAPRRFRIIDVITREPLLQDGGTRQAVAALSSVRSIVDVNVSVWDDERQRWLPLPFAEERMLLDLARGQRSD